MSVDLTAYEREARLAAQAKNRARWNYERALEAVRECERIKDETTAAAVQAEFAYSMAKQGYLRLPGRNQWLNPDWAAEHPDVTAKLLAGEKP